MDRGLSVRNSLLAREPLEDLVTFIMPNFKLASEIMSTSQWRVILTHSYSSIQFFRWQVSWFCFCCFDKILPNKQLLKRNGSSGSYFPVTAHHYGDVSQEFELLVTSHSRREMHAHKLHCSSLKTQTQCMIPLILRLYLSTSVKITKIISSIEMLTNQPVPNGHIMRLSSQVSLYCVKLTMKTN